MTTLPAYLAATHSIVLKQLSEVSANNIANGHTDGFKQDMALVTPLKTQINSREAVHYVMDGPRFLDVSQGALKQTQNAYTVALMGPGFFKMENGLYTRSGTLLQNEVGELVNGEGQRFLSVGGGPIVVPPGEQIFISKDGMISTAQGDIDQLGVFSFEDEKSVQKAGNNLYTTDQPEQPVESPQVLQGFVEASNVQPAKELINLLNYTSTYQQDMDFIARTYGLQEDLVPKLLKV